MNQKFYFTRTTLSLSLLYKYLKNVNYYFIHFFKKEICQNQPLSLASLFKLCRGQISNAHSSKNVYVPILFRT